MQYLDSVETRQWDESRASLWPPRYPTTMRTNWRLLTPQVGRPTLPAEADCKDRRGGQRGPDKHADAGVRGGPAGPRGVQAAAFIARPERGARGRVALVGGVQAGPTGPLRSAGDRPAPRQARALDQGRLHRLPHRAGDRPAR